VTDHDPEQAAQIANTLVEAFVTWSRDYNRKSIRAAIAEVESRLKEARSTVISLGSRVQREDQNAALTAELEIATANYTTLARQLEDLSVTEQLEVGGGTVYSPAVAVMKPVAPRPVRSSAIGLAVGLIVGLGIASIREYLDTTIRSTDEVEALYGTPVLGVIPAEMSKNEEKRSLTILRHPGSAASEAYRGLRNSLDFINFEHSIKTLLVGSAEPSEGKSTVAANLATSLAQAGKRVVFVNCDFRRPTTDQFFRVMNEVGLADVLAGTNRLESVLQHPEAQPNLSVLTSGKLPPNPSEMLGSTKMRDVIETLAAAVDWVIIDSPPVLAVADAGAVARWSDGVLIVSKAGSSTRDAARKSRETLENVGARILGAVVWGLETHAYAGGYGYAEYGSYRAYRDVDASVEGRRRRKHGRARS
jgi:capsular exopolysaccharide synthesis family protein